MDHPFTPAFGLEVLAAPFAALVVFKVPSPTVRRVVDVVFRIAWFVVAGVAQLIDSGLSIEVGVAVMCALLPFVLYLIALDRFPAARAARLQTLFLAQATAQLAEHNTDADLRLTLKLVAGDTLRISWRSGVTYPPTTTVGHISTLVRHAFPRGAQLADGTEVEITIDPVSLDQAL